VTGRLTAGACLSLSGRFAQFGVQAERGLRLWADEYGVDLTIGDDESDPAVLTERLSMLASFVDVLLGPYSTVLTRAAINVSQQNGKLLFNHGGSGGKLDIPGRVVNVLTPAGGYAEPFVDMICSPRVPLYTTTGRGAFGRDVTAGAARVAETDHILTMPLDFDAPPQGVWDLISAGVYKDDVAAVRRARALPNPPWHVCSISAGVASFAHDVGDPEGVFGVGQWAPGVGDVVDVGMAEPEFLAAWRVRFGGVPDYPGVQAYAAGVIAAEAVRIAGSTAAESLWSALADMNMATVFGRFRIDGDSGVQVGHEAVLTQWRGGTQQSC
jgi:ABC-type branched-subunit amino acid transport system substrate-binding protein